MNEVSIDITWSDVLAHVRAYTLKAGLASPGEDGRHGEREASDDDMDAGIIKQSCIEGIGIVAEIVRPYLTATSEISRDEEDWTLELILSDRNTATSGMLSALSLGVVVDYCVTQWYAMTDAGRVPDWERRQAGAEARLIQLLNSKKAPEL